MAALEELMALFGRNEAPGAQGLGRGPADDDPRRRRAGQDSGFGGIAGGNVSIMDLLPHLQGLRTYDYSGPNIRGLADLLPGMQAFQGVSGPAKRHLERQAGPDFDMPPGLGDLPFDLPPGVDNRAAIGGPNVAPGNVDTGLALGQPPGLPAQAQGRAMPHTQGWRNVAPGYGVQAQLGFGTPQYGENIRNLAGVGPAGGAGGGPPSAIGAGGGVAGVGGGAGKAVGGGGGPVAVKAGGPAEAAPAAGGGGGRQPGAPAGGGGAGKPGAPAQAGGSKGPKFNKGAGKQNDPNAVVVGKGPGPSAVKGAKQKTATYNKGAGKQNEPSQIQKTAPQQPISKSSGSTAPSAGAGKQTTFTPAPKPIQKTAPQQPISKTAGVVTKPGKTKPKGTSLVGGVQK